MDQARAFALAGDIPTISELVTGAAHTAANAMVDGTNRKAKTKAAIASAKTALADYQSLVFSVYPAAMTYRPDMPEAELRAWAVSLVEALP